MASGVNFGTQQYFGFDPRTIPGCCLWLDAADARTLTTSGGGNVTQWADKSGLGATMTPLGSSSNATIQSNYQNGLSALNFSGLNQYQTPSGTGVYPSDVYILVALKTLTRMDVISIGPTSTDNFNSLTFGEHTALRWHNGSSGFARTPATVSPTNETSTSLLLMNWSLSNNNFVIRRNGTQLSSTASYTYTPTAGAIIQIGFRHQNFGTNLAFNAYVAEVLTFNRQLELAERQQVEGYLAWKWALQSNLPSTHPFRPVRPVMRAFLPVDVSGGALLWLDAADATTITGSPVTQWRDKSGRASNATTGVGSVVAGTAINSRNTLRFGSSITLNLSNFVMPSAQTSIFYIFKGITTNPNAGAGTGYFLFSRTTDNFAAFTGNEQFFSYQNPVAGRSYVAVMGPPGERNWGNLSTTAFFNAVNVISTTGISYASSNGLSLPLVASSNVSNSVATASTYQISTTRAVGDVYTYDLGELVVCDGTVSTTTAQQLEGYLAWKWGVQGSLPTTHPYYRVLPSTPLFSPPQLSGVAFWLDAADPTTFTLSGSTITQWRDKSSNGYTGTPSGSPVQTTINGLPAVAFNGSTQYFDFGDVADLGAANLNIFCVAKFNSTANGSLFAKSLLGAAAFRYSILRESGNLLTLLESSGGLQGVGSVADSSLATRVLSWTWDRTTNILYRDGTLASSVALASSATFNSAYNLLVGAYNNGSGTTPPAGGFYLNGVICEILFLFGTLATIQRQEVEGYLAWKWGLQANLPSTHPFATFRP